MDRAWTIVAGLAVLAATALGITLATPDVPVPVVAVEADTTRADLARALDLAAAELRRDPAATAAELANLDPLVVDVERREPSGLAFAIPGLAIAAFGAVVVTRAGNAWGRLVVAFGAVAGVLGLARAVADLAVRSAAVPAVVAQAAFAVGDVGWIALGVLLGPVLLLRLPNGALVSPRWVVGEGLAALASVLLLVQLAQPLRFDGRALAPLEGVDVATVDAVFVLGLLAWQAALLVAAASVVVRHRRAVGAELRQLRWIAFGVTASVVLLALSDVAQRLDGSPAFWGPVGAAGFLVLLPSCVAVAVLRHRLFAIDVVVNRTLVFGVLSIAVALAYVVILAVASSLLDVGRTPAAVLALLVVAVAVEPLRAWVVAQVDRTVWRRGADARSTMDDVIMAVGRRGDPDQVLQRLVAAARDSANAAEVSLRAGHGQGVDVLAIEPHDAEAAELEACDLVLPVGRGVVLAVRARPGDRVRRGERVVVRAVATVCGLVLDDVRLRDELGTVLAELELRRRDLADAEERLRAVVSRTSADVERDLHDGAQARAVALAAMIGLARAAPHRAGRDELLAAVDGARREVHAFAHGLDPDVLREGGLAEALREQAALVLPGAELRLAVGDLPREVSSVGYLVATEAMVNVAKHAPGAAAVVTCRTTEGRLRLSVVDDGPGMSAEVIASPASLATIRERVSALGGTVGLDATHGEGTAVHVAIPVDA